MAMIRDRSFGVSPVQIAVDSFNPDTGQTAVTVTMHSTTESLSGDDILFFVVEDDVDPSGHPNETHVTRAMISDTISLTGQGNTAFFSPTFTIDPSWDPTKLYLVVFIQQADHTIVQVASSSPQPTYKARAMVPWGRSIIGPEVPFESDPLTIMNIGPSDTYTATLVVDSVPPGWTVAFKDGGGTPHTDPYDFVLSADAQANFTVTVNPISPGYVKFHFDITSPNLDRTISVPIVYVTDNVDVLLIDDDGGYSYEDYYAAALDDVGVSYGLWDLEAAKLTSDVADTMNLLIWDVGLGYPSLDATDRAFLESYLDSGRSLFISGQDVGWDLCYYDSGNTDVAFYNTYLHANYVADDTNILNVDGVAGDRITDGLSLHIAGGDGANNESYPSWIEPYDGRAVRIFTYQGADEGAAIRAVDSVSGARLVYLAFGYEAIDNATDRAALMRSAVFWLQGGVFADDFESGGLGAWSDVVN